MAAPLVPQEIYLLERYASRDYFERLVDAFACCVKAAEDALAKFMTQLPPDYRSRPLWQQPDATWGETVLPNLRLTLASLNTGFVQVSNGDLTGLSFAGNVDTAFGALQRDYDSEWMVEPEQARFDACMREASKLASNIFKTAQHQWRAGTLTVNYQAETRGDLDAPAAWPSYRATQGVQVATGSPVPRSGIYLPDRNDSSAQFLIKGHGAPQCSVPRKHPDPAVLSAARDLFDTTWTFVERTSDVGGGIPLPRDPDAVTAALRCEAGQPCPKAGWWITPASDHSRRLFASGQIMPALASDYGHTIWQWAVDQHGDAAR